MLSALQYISLSDNNIIGTIPTELAMARKLQKINLRDNDLTGTIPSEFGTFVGLNIIILGKRI